MNCRDIESLLLAERDGVLTPAQHAALAEHVAACPACRRLRADLTETTLFLKTEAANVAVPDAAGEWRELRAHLHSGKARPAKRHPLAPVIWFGASLAAAAAVALIFIGHRPPPAIPVAPAAVEIVRTENIGADDSNVSTMVYVDKDSGWLVVWSTGADTKGSG